MTAILPQEAQAAAIPEAAATHTGAVIAHRIPAIVVPDHPSAEAVHHPDIQEAAVQAAADLLGDNSAGR